MSLEIVLDDEMLWNEEAISFCKRNKLSFCNEDDMDYADAYFDSLKGKPRAIEGNHYYQIKDDGCVVGEFLIVPQNDEDYAEQFDIGIYLEGHNYAEQAIRLYVSKISSAKKIYAVVKEKNPYISKMRKILCNIGFIEIPRMQDKNPMLKGLLYDDYNFVFEKNHKKYCS